MCVSCTRARTTARDWLYVQHLADATTEVVAAILARAGLAERIAGRLTAPAAGSALALTSRSGVGTVGGTQMNRYFYFRNPA